jgi:transposase-like protein
MLLKELKNIEDIKMDKALKDIKKEEEKYKKEKELRKNGKETVGDSIKRIEKFMKNNPIQAG